MVFDFLKGEFIDVISWLDDTRDTMVWRFERRGQAIKYGAKLTVREGQSAVFVHEGQLADVFGPGLYMLETNNMPVMTTLQHWDHGFDSPFKSEVYFVNTTRFNDNKWGTKNPIMARDPEFGPVRLRAFGTYSMRVSDPGKFLTECERFQEYAHVGAWPKFWESNKKNGSSADDAGVPWPLIVIASLIKNGVEEKRAWEMPECQAIWLNAAYAAMNGSEQKILTTDEEAFMDEQERAEKAAKVAASAEVKTPPPHVPET
jgi:hypothetical protein